MKSSLKQFILSPGQGYTRFLQGADESQRTPDLTQPDSEPGRMLFDKLPDPEALRQAHEMRAQLSEALATTLLGGPMPTRKAPTLRLAVEALRCA